MNELLWYVDLENRIFGEYDCKVSEHKSGTMYISDLDTYGKVGVSIFATKEAAFSKLGQDINQVKKKLNQFYQECLDYHAHK